MRSCIESKWMQEKSSFVRGSVTHTRPVALLSQTPFWKRMPEPMKRGQISPTRQMAVFFFET